MSEVAISREQVLGVVLAGGLSRRMEGGDKSLKLVSGKTLIERVLARFGPQVPELIINANGDTALFSHLGHTIVPDVFGGFAGPLAGVLTGLSWAEENRPDVTHVLTVPCDGPFLPVDYGAQMTRQMRQADIAMAHSNGRTHPVAGLWPVRLKSSLATALEKGVRKVDLWTADFDVALVEFSNEDGVDPFFNANRPGDLQQAEKFLKTKESRG